MGALLGLILSGMTGCALISPTEPYEISDMEMLGAIYRPASHQAVVMPDQPILLEDAIKIALQNNPELAMVKHTRDAAEARHSQAIGRALPKISAIGGYTQYIDDQRLVPPRYNGSRSWFASLTSIYPCSLHQSILVR